MRTWNNWKIDAHYIIGILWWTQKIFVTLTVGWGLFNSWINQNIYSKSYDELALGSLICWKDFKNMLNVASLLHHRAYCAFICSRFNWCRNIWKEIKKCYSSFSWITFTMFAAILIWKIDFLATASLMHTYIYALNEYVLQPPT